jgi:hypothetical protein
MYLQALTESQANNSTEGVSLHYLLLSLCPLHRPELVGQIPSPNTLIGSKSKQWLKKRLAKELTFRLADQSNYTMKQTTMPHQ